MSNLITTAKDEQDFELMRGYAPGERKIIKDCIERAWRKNK